MPKTETAKETILRLLREQGPMDAETLAAECGVAYKTARNHIADLIAAGFVEVGEKVLGRKQYVAVPPESAPLLL